MRQKITSEKFRSFGRLTPLATLLVLPLWGCTTARTYKGPELPKSEVSVIQKVHRHGTSLGFAVIIAIPLPRHDTVVTQLDGEQYSPIAAGGEFHVPPGKHRATVYYWRYPPITLCGGLGGCVFDYQAVLSIDFATEAGHEYSIPAERREERDWIWVEDITTGKVVAGEKPPPEPPPTKEPSEEEPTP